MSVRPPPQLSWPPRREQFEALRGWLVDVTRWFGGITVAAPLTSTYDRAGVRIGLNTAALPSSGGTGNFIRRVYTSGATWSKPGASNFLGVLA
jgi:hypothetical protein